jgi:hypothetical protein
MRDPAPAGGGAGVRGGGGAGRAQDAPPEVLQALDARPDRRGRRLLRVLDAGAVAAAFGTWLKAQVTAGLADTTALPPQDGAGPQETPPGPSPPSLSRNENDQSPGPAGSPGDHRQTQNRSSPPITR